MTGTLSRRLALGLLGSVPVAAAVAAGGNAQAAPPPSLLPGGTFDQRLAQLAAQHQLSVTVLLAYRGRPVLARVFGKGIRPDTIFALGSVTKLFTATAVMQLAAQGKVGLYQTLGSYLDGFPAQIAGTVTIHQLLTHTSGMDDYLGSSAYEQQRLTWTSAAQVMDGTMAIVRQSPLLFAPGTQYSYSNSGYVTLGAVAAQVSGQSYYDYVREHIFAPAGMARSDFYTRPQWLTDPRIAHPYGTAGGKGQPGGPVIDLTSQEDFIGSPAGNAFATAPDMVRFARALTGGRLLSPAWAGVMTSAKVALTPQQAHQWPPSQLAAVGYAPEIRIVNDQTVFGHSGGAAGESAIITIYPDQDWVTVILSNSTITSDAQGLIKLLDQLITRRLRSWAEEGAGPMRYVLALSRSAFVIRHWFEIDLDDAHMEHGARIELRELPLQPHRGTESAAQLVTLDRPLWRADLFDRLADAPGTFGAAHYHPGFDGNEPCGREWDAALTADPWAWLGDQVASLGTASGDDAWPVDPADAAEIRGLAGTVVATARQFEASGCTSAADCYQMTRDVRDTVRLMIGTLRDPALLDTGWVSPWTT